MGGLNVQERRTSRSISFLVEKAIPTEMLKKDATQAFAAVGAAIERRASMALSARYSWMNPRMTARRRITAMAMASTTCPSRAESATAMRRTMMRTFLNCARRSFHAEMPSTFLSSLGPSSRRRARASASVRPWLGSVPRRSSVRAMLMVCHARSTSDVGRFEDERA